MSFCPTCEKEFLYATVCPECGFNFSGGQPSESSFSHQSNYSTTYSRPTICTLLQIIAWLNLVSGIIASFFFFGHKYEGLSISQPLIIPGIGCIIVGVIGAILFWAVSEIISYLNIINENIYLGNKMQKH